MVSENEVIPIRVKFKKVGSLMYISHLDLMRTVQRIVVRSGIDIWYSEGFNPQPKIALAAPLPIGVESECEFLDMRIVTPMTYEEIKARLQRNFPSEMEVLEVYAPESKIRDIAYIDYDIEIHSPKISQETENTLKALVKEPLYVMKKSKGNEKEINVCDYINSFEAKYEGNNAVKIKTVLASGSEKNLSPELLVEAIRKYTGLMSVPSTDEYYSIMRKRVLKEDLTEYR